MKLKSVTVLILLTLPFAVLAEGSSRAGKFDAQLEKRFTAADKNGDGQLSRDEAKAGMPMVYKRFDSIDVEHKGYLTLDQIRAAFQNRPAAQ